jgi:predicted RNA binding protein YcfA (HicA-like mRNA interferase family)
LPKLPVVSAPETVRALQRAGFLIHHQVGSHVTMVHPDTDREAVVPHHGGRDLKPGTLRGIIRDAGLTVEEFRRLLR